MRDRIFSKIGLRDSLKGPRYDHFGVSKQDCEVAIVSQAACSVPPFCVVIYVCMEPYAGIARYVLIVV